MQIADGLSLAYMETGAGEPPVVFIHGMGSYRGTFYPLFEDPPVPGHLVAVDLPGFGDSGHYRHRQTIPDYVRAVVQFLDALNLNDPFLVGHSFGGMVAGEVAIADPGRVRGVILISSAGWFFPEHVLSPTPYVWFNRMGIWLTSTPCFGKSMMQSLGVTPDQISVAEQQDLQWGWRHAYEMARMGRFYETPDFADRLIQGHRPVAVIHGSQDVLFPLERVKAVIDDRLPLWTIDGAGHLPFFSHRRPFTEALREAYAQVSVRPRSDIR